ncbi:MAG: ATP-binding cassette domain-containing protein [Bacteroidales bacterium]|nr:ATP-binding cassette domain-containing protein [Bacteroidales bacterium]
MLIEAKGIVKAYSGHVALDGLNMEVPEGAVHGLLGPNGAGKTTFIRILNQMTHQDSGTLLFDGHEMSMSDVGQIGYLPEERGLYKKMKVGEEAIYLARLRGLSKYDAKVRLKYWFDKFEIGDWWNKKVEQLSKGMQQKVQFIVTVLHEPRLLIFDEPFSGFDPVNANLLKEEILNLRDKGATVLFSTHNMGSVEAVCDSISLINKSHVVLNGNVKAIKNQYKEGKYSLTFQGTESDLQKVEGIEILSAKAYDGMTEAIVKSATKANANAMLRELINAVELSEFKEILPSMEEIFIQQVNNK